MKSTLLKLILNILRSKSLWKYDDSTRTLVKYLLMIDTALVADKREGTDTYMVETLCKGISRTKRRRAIINDFQDGIFV